MTTSIVHLAGRLPYGKPATWRRETGEATSQRGRVRDGRLPEPSGCRFAGELLDIERVTSSSERGGWKSAYRGNSPAAYSTSHTVLRGRGDSNVSLLPDMAALLRCWTTRNPLENKDRSAGGRPRIIESAGEPLCAASLPIIGGGDSLDQGEGPRERAEPGRDLGGLLAFVGLRQPPEGRDRRHGGDWTSWPMSIRRLPRRAAQTPKKR